MDSTNFQHHEHHHHHHHHHQQHQQQQQQNQHQHHQQLQDHFVGCSPLNIPTSAYGVSSNSTTSLQWNNSSILPSSTTTSSNNTTFISNKPYEDSEFLSNTTQVSHMPKLEDDMLSSSFPSFTGLIQSATNNNGTTTLDNINPWSFSNLLSSASGVPYSRGLMQQFPLEVNNWSNNNNNNTSFLNQLGLVSSPNNSTASTVSSSSPRLGMNLQAMDFLGNNSSFGAQNQPMSSYDVLGGEEVISPVGKIMPNKNSTLMNNGSLTGTKRAAAGSSSSDQSKASTSSNHNVGTKKSSLKVSCPPFKVRKEKLGERIAALHQLVSPFGKTDTASVLTEAIGYIQFLQDQIHTLCMPQGHAKPSRSKPCRPFQMGLGSSEDDAKEEEVERVELRRRGLCLVPFSWSSFVTPNQLDASNHSPYY